MNEVWTSCSLLSSSDSSPTGDVLPASAAALSLCRCVCICLLRGNSRPESGEIFKDRPVGSLLFTLLGWLATLFMHQTCLLPGKIGSWSTEDAD